MERRFLDRVLPSSIVARPPERLPSGEGNRPSRVVEHEHDGFGIGKNIFDEKISLNVSVLLVNPACQAGVLTSRPNFKAR